MTKMEIENFLAFLADDIKCHPEVLSSFSPMLAERIAALTSKVATDLDTSIDGKVDL